MLPLFLITARGGSKGLPGKNIRMLGGKPLIQYSVEVARSLAQDEDICVSTDDQEIINIIEGLGLSVPFRRPAALATDTANSRDVILHALDFYQSKGRTYDAVVLLQPTSPFRSQVHLKQMMNDFDPSLEMVVSVAESHYNPYFSLFEETSAGFLTLSKQSSFTRRQECPHVYAYNGSAYVINSSALKAKHMSEFERVRKFIMDDIHSLDIDTQFDWWVAEMILEKSLWCGYEAKGL